MLHYRYGVKLNDLDQIICDKDDSSSSSGGGSGRCDIDDHEENLKDFKLLQKKKFY